MNPYKNLTSIYILLSALNLNADNTSLLNPLYRKQLADEAFQSIGSRIKDIHSGDEPISIVGNNDQDFLHQSTYHKPSKWFTKLNEDWNEVKVRVQSLKRDPQFIYFFNPKDDRFNLEDTFEKINYFIKSISQADQKSLMYKKHIGLNTFLKNAYHLKRDFCLLIKGIETEEIKKLREMKNASIITKFFSKKEPIQTAIFQSKFADIKNRVIKENERLMTANYLDNEIRKVNTRFIGAKNNYSLLANNSLLNVNKIISKLNTNFEKKSFPLEGEFVVGDEGYTESAIKKLTEIGHTQNIKKSDRNMASFEALPVKFNKAKHTINVTRESLTKIEKSFEEKIPAKEQFKETLSNLSSLLREFRQSPSEEQFLETLSKLKDALREFRQNPSNDKDVEGKEQNGTLISNNELVAINNETLELEYFQTLLGGLTISADEINIQTKKAQALLYKLSKISDGKNIKRQEKDEKKRLAKNLKENFTVDKELVDINNKARELEFFQERILDDPKIKIEIINDEAKKAQTLLSKLLEVRKEIQKKEMERRRKEMNEFGN